MFRCCTAILLFVLVGACEKGVKPAASTPPKSSSVATNRQTVDQTPELDPHPRALYHAPGLSGATAEVPTDLALVKRYFEPAGADSLVPSDGFTATANHSCPIMQKMKLNATTAVEHTVEFEGKTIGFCCADCVEAWNSMSDDERRALLTTVIKPK